jgi:hypothetical protein
VQNKQHVGVIPSVRIQAHNIPKFNTGDCVKLLDGSDLLGDVEYPLISQLSYNYLVRIDSDLYIIIEEILELYMKVHE